MTMVPFDQRFRPSTNWSEYFHAILSTHNDTGLQCLRNRVRAYFRRAGQALKMVPFSQRFIETVYFALRGTKPKTWVEAIRLAGKDAMFPKTSWRLSVVEARIREPKVVPQALKIWYRLGGSRVQTTLGRGYGLDVASFRNAAKQTFLADIQIRWMDSPLRQRRRLATTGTGLQAPISDKSRTRESARCCKLCERCKTDLSCPFNMTRLAVPA